MLPLSQSHLTLLEACPRKYQYVFFDALLGPSSYEQRVTTQWGNQFHLLMQQAALDLPVGAIAPADTELADSMQALSKAAPDVFAHLPTASVVTPEASESSGNFSQSEHRRTLSFNGYLLTVIYDLVVFSERDPKAAFENTQVAQGSQEKGVLGGVSTDSSGHIFDWKTHQKPPPKAWLANDWQTRLYRYVLCETTDLSPEQISMTYWFVRPSSRDSQQSSQPTSYRFDYSQLAHDLTRQDLQRLTDQLTLMRQQANFPKVSIDKGLCDRCPYNVRCDRSDRAFSQDPSRLLKAASQLTADSAQEVSW
ncbi:MAG: PD-(D/E)XK nuclease family protein [Cyanobacteria bacterium J06606_4]